MSEEQRYVFECLRTPLVDGDRQICTGLYRIELEGIGNGFKVESMSSEWPEKIVNALNLSLAINSLRDAIDKRIEKSKEDLEHIYKKFRSGDGIRENIFPMERLKEQEILSLETFRWLLDEKLGKEQEP